MTGSDVTPTDTTDAAVTADSNEPEIGSVVGLAVYGDGLCVEIMLPGMRGAGASLGELTQPVRDALRRVLDAADSR